MFGDSRLPDRFWRKVSVRESGCWEWTAANSHGRGQIQWKCPDGVRRRMSVYRLAFEAAHGSIDPKLAIDHLCENPSCCNPDHLEQVTHAENTHRHFARHPVTHCPRGHAKTEDNIYERSGNRCRLCHSDTTRAYRERNPVPKKERERRLVDRNGIIRSARAQAGLALRHVASVVGTDKGTLSTWERGVASIGLGQVARIVEALGIDPSQLETA